MTEYAKKLLRLYHEQSKKNRIIEGSLPLNFKGKGKDLKNYRIYGNTVNGESVGDLITEGEHAGEYSVPVTVEGKNLLPTITASYSSSGILIRSESDGTLIVSGTATAKIFPNLRENISYPFDTILSGCPQGGSTEGYCLRSIATATHSIVGTDFGNGTLIPANTEVRIEIRIENGCECNNLKFKPMIRKADIEDDTYEPYHAPVTTPIYLPEPIKIVGDEAEYIDYAEQKQHRVRKNLVQTIATSQTINDITFTVNANGSVTCNGTNYSNNPIMFELNNPDVVFPEGVYITSGCPAGGSITGGYKIQYFNGSSWNYELGSGSTFTLSGNLKYRSRILISKDVTVTNLTFYPMLRLATIDDDTYEPYIENVDLDVTLPALPTLSGTNTLSVGTEVQPSKVEIKGKIKAVQEGSGENEGE